MAADHSVMNLDFQTAFTSISLDKMLETTRDFVPNIFCTFTLLIPLHSYFHWDAGSSFLPKGVEHFCLALPQFCQCLSSDFYISSLDEATIGGSCADIFRKIPPIFLNVRQYF